MGGGKSRLFLAFFYWRKMVLFSPLDKCPEMLYYPCLYVFTEGAFL